MPEDESAANLTPTPPSPQRQSSDDEPAVLLGEDSILELITGRAPVSYVLNRLCAAIDLQIGNVVSVILLADDTQHDLQNIAHRASQYGLNVFWSAILSLRAEHPLGYFEMYCCVPQKPSPFELKLIQRVADLAVLSIRRLIPEPELESSSMDPNYELCESIPDRSKWN